MNETIRVTERTRMRRKAKRATCDREELKLEGDLADDSRRPT